MIGLMISHIVAFYYFIDDDPPVDEYLVPQAVLFLYGREDHFDELSRTVDLHMIFSLFLYHADYFSRPYKIYLFHNQGICFW